MPPEIASLIFVILILGLFWADRDPNLRTSKAFWIPTAWVLINASRPVSAWLTAFGYNVGPQKVTADIYIEGSPFDRAVYTTLVVAALVILFGRRRQVGSLVRRNYAILLFFGYAAISMIWSDFPIVTLKHWTKSIGDLAMVLVVLTEPDITAATKRLFSRVGFLLVPLSVLYCKYYPDIGRHMTKSWMNTYTGVTDQKNTLGWLCLLVGLGFLWRFLAAYRDRQGPNRSRRILAYGVILGMIVWLLHMSDSMTSFSSLVLAGTVMILANRPLFRRNPAAIHVLVAAVLGITIFALFFDPTGSLLENLGRNRTLTGRTAIWTHVLMVPFNRLVGVGYESFWLGDRLVQLQAAIGFDVNEAHNGYLEIFLNLGWIGVALLALIIVTGYRKVIAALRASPEAGSLYLACFLAVLFANLTEACFRMLTITWIFFLFSILAASRSRVLEGLPAHVAAPTKNLARDEAQVGDVSLPQEVN